MGFAWGYHVLDETLPYAMPACTFMDSVGAKVAEESAERAVRIYYKGRPGTERVARMADFWSGRGARVIVGNEPNVASEGFGGGPADYAAWFLEVANRVGPSTRLYYAGISPGVPGWLEYYAHPLAQQALRRAAGLCAHAYGDADEVTGMLGLVLQSTPPDVPVWVGEWNFGAGRKVEVESWAPANVPRVLDWCASQPRIEAATWFAWKWPTPDTPLPTPVDAAGTAVERAIRAWRPKEAPVQHVTAKLVGVDLYNQSPVVDFPTLAAGGRSFVVHKASGDVGDLGGTDPRLAERFPLIKAEGLLAGVYHFARPDRSSPADSVTLLQRAVEGLTPPYTVWLDWEVLGQDDAHWVPEWLDLAARVGLAPGLYAGLRELNSLPDDVRAALLARYQLWLAYYAREAPPIPWRMWQWTAGASVPGVRGLVDEDVFDGTAADWLAMGVT